MSTRNPGLHPRKENKQTTHQTNGITDIEIVNISSREPGSYYKQLLSWRSLIMAPSLRAHGIPHALLPIK
jgi:hypothetical protein